MVGGVFGPRNTHESIFSFRDERYCERNRKTERGREGVGGARNRRMNENEEAWLTSVALLTTRIDVTEPSSLAAGALAKHPEVTDHS